jgi:ligand-binding sensor domain-containing protein/signal transduction histidine kinase
MHKKRSLFFLLLATLALSLFPLPVAAQSNTIRFERLTVEDGLSQNAILAIAQDAQGFLWFGTEDGLNKYDGYQFVVFEHDPENPSTLVDNFVSAIHVDMEGELWIGTRSGLDRYDRATGNFIHYSGEAEDSSGFQGKWVTSIFEDRQGRLWIGTFEGGLNRVDRTNSTFSHYRHDEEVSSSLGGDTVSAIYEDSAGDLWIGTQNGLDRFDEAQGTFTHFRHEPDDPTSLSDDSVTAISEDDQGYLWIGTGAGGINRFDPGSESFRRFQHDPERPDSLSHDRVRAVHQDLFGNLWIGTQNGLDLLTAGSALDSAAELGFEHYRHDPFDPKSLGSSAVWSIYEDQSGVMWFGTWGGGLSKYNQSTDRFRVYQHSPSQPNSLSDNIVWSIVEDSKGRLWIGTLNGGLNRLDRSTGELVVYRNDEADAGSLLSNDVRSIIEDRSGTLWVGTAGGLDRFNPRTNRFTHLTHDPEDSNSLSGDQVIVLLESRSGAIWVGTRYDGLNRLDPSTGEFTRFQHEPDDPLSLGEDRVWALYEDHLGAIWVGTLGGVSVLEPGSNEFTRYQHDPEDPESLSSDSIFAFYEDPAGYMWIGTWGGGLDRFDRATETFDHYTESDGLPNNSIYGIEVDAEGQLWMSTNWGLSRFDPRSETFRNYDISDGLQDNEFNVGAHFTGESGEMFFGGIRGFNAFFPDEIQKNPYVPPIVITTFYIFNQPVRYDLLPDEQIELSYKENFIAFEFSAMDFNSPGKNQYAYRLEGLDESWIEAGTRRYVSYTNLKGGDYVFRVKGSNSDGVWNETGVSVRITVTPPFWETVWFRVVAIVVVIALAFGGLQLRVRAIEARSRELEGTVRERTREIEQRTSELDALYRADGELIQHLEMEQVFRALVDIAVEILHADKGSLLFWDDDLQKLVVRAAKGFKPETTEQMRFTTDEGSAGWVMANGRPAIVRDVRDDQRVSRRITDAEGIQSFMHVPIQIGDAIYGVFSVAYLEPRGFGAEEQRLFSALAKRAALAIEQAQLQDQAQQTAVLEERQRLARDLHDEVTQTLFSASLVAEVLPALWEKDPEIGRSRLEALRELTRGALAEMRTLLIELRPSAIEEAELGELMRQLAESTTGRARIAVQLDVEGDCELGSEVKVALYRVAQEALNNVAKHSEASQIDMQLLCGEDVVVLRVEDDGIGFNPDTVSPEHLGQAIMRERAESVGAEMSIESTPGEGTRVILTWRRDSQ